jgi:hypothetical protein
MDNAMKKNTIGILLTVIIWGMSGCSDFLDQPVLGRENLDTYFQSEEECLKQLAGCYNGIFLNNWQMPGFYVATDMSSDDLWMGNTTQSQIDWIRMAHYGNPSQDAMIKNIWTYHYRGILRCNLVIQKIPGAPVSSESLQKRMVAEAKFIRAFHYFELAKLFGGLPFVLEMKLPDEVKGITRESIENTYAYIEQDLKDAMVDLPQRSQYAASDMGRITKGAALGYLAKSYLYQEKYNEAATVLAEIINSEEYQLLPDFKDVWTIEYNNSVESLFEIQYNTDLSYNLGQRFSVFTGSRNDSGWSWGQPTSNLENAFKDAGDSYRLLWTIVKHGDNVPGDDDPMAQNYVIDPGQHKSARINRKFYIPHAQRPAPYDAQHNNLNHRMLRYADVLLMNAEAQNMLGDDAAARASLNQIRERVHLPVVMASGKELRDAIRLERRLELALEHQRLFDLRRWTDDNGKKALCNILGPNGSFVKYNLEESTDMFEKTNQGENSNKGISFQENRDLLFPIPYTEIALSEGSLEQNPNF